MDEGKLGLLLGVVVVVVVDGEDLLGKSRSREREAEDE